MTVRILKRAWADLAELEAWIRAQDPATADQVLDRIFDGLDQLESHPTLGPVSRDPVLAEKGIRCLTRSSYVIFYRCVGKDVRVLRVLRAVRSWRHVH